jgi:hypothetical protein
MWNFKNIGNIDVLNYKKIFDLNDDWDNEFTQRRNELFKAHISTKVIPICWSRESLNFSPEIVAPKTRFWDTYYDEVFFNDIFKNLNKFYGKGYFVRLVLANLLPNGIIPYHVDSGLSLEKNHRIHIPIKTNENVYFYVGDEERNIKVGEIVEINNNILHSVENRSDKNRIHLIVDWHVHPCEISQ